MQFLKIVLLGISAAVTYGILHDQVTARVCVEYFTVGHPPVFGTDDPTLLALGWGTLATWWVGLILGVALAIMTRCGPPPQLQAGQLVRPLVVLLAGVAGVAGLAGIVGWLLADAAFAPAIEPLLAQLPAAKRAPCLAVSLAHAAAYAAGFGGGMLVCLWAWLQRDAPAQTRPEPVPQPALDDSGSA